MANRPKFTAEKRAKFLAALRVVPNVTSAALECGITRRCAYYEREKDKSFAAEWDEAIEQGVDVLEREMWRRAVEGTDKPVYQGKEHVGDIREYSDTLAIFLAKGHRPEKYKERRELSGGLQISDKPINQMSRAELEKLASEGAPDAE